MVKWEYKISIHDFPEKQNDADDVIECDNTGNCFVHDTPKVGLDWLENIFMEYGEQGWELTQCGYHNRSVLCIWKRKKTEEKD